ncbi:hypothetical protein B0H13DRAFT_811716 [Mycena leptocephala]|nr:hypothetical protein B0H13DRAFT_811716 [Mycena leptocephala]
MLRTSQSLLTTALGRVGGAYFFSLRVFGFFSLFLYGFVHLFLSFRLCFFRRRRPVVFSLPTLLTLLRSPFVRLRLSAPAPTCLFPFWEHLSTFIFAFSTTGALAALHFQEVITGYLGRCVPRSFEVGRGFYLGVMMMGWGHARARSRREPRAGLGRFTGYFPDGAGGAPRGVLNCSDDLGLEVGTGAEEKISYLRAFLSLRGDGA